MPKRLLAFVPQRDGARLFHGESGEEQLWEFGLGGESVSLVHCQLEQVFVSLERVTELGDDGGSGAVDLVEEFAASGEASFGDVDAGVCVGQLGLV